MALPVAFAACGGIVDSSAPGAADGPLAPVPSAGPPAPAAPIGDLPAAPIVPAVPFGPAIDVAPTNGACDRVEPIRVPAASDQHIWKVNAAGATSVVTGNFFGTHHMNELVAVGGGYVAVATWGGGTQAQSGLVVFGEASRQGHEALPLGSGYVRTGDFAHGRFAFGGKAKKGDSAYTIWEQRPDLASGLTVIATLPKTDFATIRVGLNYVYAKGTSTLWRIGKGGDAPLDTFAGATHFTWDDSSEANGLFWSTGASIRRVGVDAPIVTLSEDVMALGFDAKQKKLYATTSAGLVRFNADGSEREELLRAKANNAPGPVANDAWMYPTGKHEIFANNGIVRFPVNCYNNADLSDVVPYEVDTNKQTGRWLSSDPAYLFIAGIHEHYDAVDAALYRRQ